MNEWSFDVVSRLSLTAIPCLLLLLLLHYLAQPTTTPRPNHTTTPPLLSTTLKTSTHLTTQQPQSSSPNDLAIPITFWSLLYHSLHFPTNQLVFIRVYVDQDGHYHEINTNRGGLIYKYYYSPPYNFFHNTAIPTNSVIEIRGPVGSLLTRRYEAGVSHRVLFVGEAVGKVVQQQQQQQAQPQSHRTTTPNHQPHNNLRVSAVQPPPPPFEMEVVMKDGDVFRHKVHNALWSHFLASADHFNANRVVMNPRGHDKLWAHHSFMPQFVVPRGYDYVLNCTPVVVSKVQPPRGLKKNGSVHFYQLDPRMVLYEQPIPPSMQHDEQKSGDLKTKQKEETNNNNNNNTTNHNKSKNNNKPAVPFSAAHHIKQHFLERSTQILCPKDGGRPLLPQVGMVGLLFTACEGDYTCFYEITNIPTFSPQHLPLTTPQPQQQQDEIALYNKILFFFKLHYLFTAYSRPAGLRVYQQIRTATYEQLEAQYYDLLDEMAAQRTTFVIRNQLAHPITFPALMPMRGFTAPPPPPALTAQPQIPQQAQQVVPPTTTTTPIPTATPLDGVLHTLPADRMFYTLIYKFSKTRVFALEVIRLGRGGIFGEDDDGGDDSSCGDDDDDDDEAECDNDNMCCPHYMLNVLTQAHFAYGRQTKLSILHQGEFFSHTHAPPNTTIPDHSVILLAGTPRALQERDVENIEHIVVWSRELEEMGLLALHNAYNTDLNRLQKPSPQHHHHNNTTNAASSQNSKSGGVGMIQTTRPALTIPSQPPTTATSPLHSVFRTTPADLGPQFDEDTPDFRLEDMHAELQNQHVATLSEEQITTINTLFYQHLCKAREYYIQNRAALNPYNDKRCDGYYPMDLF